MLNDIDGNDLAGLIDRDSDLHRLEAFHFVDRNSIGRSRSSRSSLSQSVVDRRAGHRHAGLNIELSSRDILTNQHIETGVDEILTEVRSLVVLDNIDGNDLAGLVDRDSDLHRLEALHLIDRNSIGRSRSSRSSLSQSVVDRRAGHRHAGLNIELSSRDILTNQHIETGVDEILTEVRSLVVLDNIDGNDLAGLVNRDSDLHRLETLNVIYNRFSRGVRFRGSSGIISLNSDAVCGSSLADRIVDGVGSHGHTGLHVNLSSSDILANERGQRFIGKKIGAEARGLAMIRSSNRSNLAVGNFNINGKLTEALYGVRIAGYSGFAAEFSSSLSQSIIDRVGSHGHAGLHIDLGGRDILTGQRIKACGDQISAEARSFVVLDNRHSDDLASLVNLNSNLHRTKALNVIGLRAALSRSSSLSQSIVNRVGSHGHAGLDVNLSGRDILTNKVVKACSDQVSAEARSLVVLDNRNGNDLAGIVNRNFDLHRTKALNIVGVCSNDRLSRFAGSRSGGSKDRVLIARIRRNTERILGISNRFGNRADISGRGNGRAANRIDMIAERIGIGRDGDELILERIFCNLRSQTSGLLKGTDISLSDITINMNADSNRDRSAVTVRRSSHGVADNLSIGILGCKDFFEETALGEAFVSNLLIFAARENGIKRIHLRSELLLLDRALGHLVSDSKQHRSNEREDEQTKRKLHNITHSSFPPQSS